MDTLLIIICIMAGSFAFSTLLYLYFAYTSKPNPEEEVEFIKTATAIKFGAEDRMKMKVAIAEKVA
ncbi:hypothetical protein R9C00_06610 [Flammeovirgaceae bacterium SG7u.111]|nr:hypothetical protein [Flammeovirgaceae bacterium SG7u.132]WPO37113.1 hypothetical protein R9C00_06610 [Flammeovirgaceae bacterium SG7u.111]